MTTLARVLAQSSDLAWRNLLHLRRTPTALVSSLVQPVLFALLIGYVFGGSLGGSAYREYLVAGLLTQAVVFTTSFTTVGLANDLQQGVVDRFRTLPIARMSLLLGRAVSDLGAGMISVLVTLLCGLALGWVPHTGAAHVAAAFLLLIVFAFATCWIGVFIALVTPTVQVAGSLGLIWIFPVTFVSSGFVSTTTLPSPLQTLANWNPFSGLANALRVLFGNAPPPGFVAQHGWSATHPVLYATICAVVLLLVFATLSTWRYRVRTSN